MMSSMRNRLLQTCLIAAISAPVQAQEAEPVTAEEALENSADSWSILIDDDACAEDDQDSDVIVVCRRKIDPEQFMSVITREISPEDDIPRARDPGSEFGLPPCEPICIGFGSMPEPAFMVDFDALPETPADSSAARLYGGPTDADSISANAPEDEVEDLSDKAQAGLADDVYGP